MARKRKGIRNEEVVELLSNLVEKSIVSLDEVSGRYRLLETIRQFGLEQLLSANESATMRDKHLAYFLDLSRDIGMHSIGNAQHLWFTRSISELENIRSALDYAYQGQRAEDAAEMLGGVIRTWEIAGLNEEADARVTEALTLANFDEMPEQHASMLRHMMMACQRRDEHERAQDFQRQAVAAAERTGNPSIVRLHQRILGNAYLAAGQFDEALEWYEKSKSGHEADSDFGSASVLYNNLGIIAFLQVRLDEAIDFFTKASESANLFGAVIMRVTSTNNLSKALVARGRLADGANEALKTFDIAKEMEALGACLELLECAAMIASATDPAEAAKLFGAIEAIRQQAKMPVLKFARYIEDWMAQTKGKVGDEEYERLVSRGRTLSMAQALEIAERRFRLTSKDQNGV